ncbi:MAG: D-alanyl-D-alanine carboxypeptidase/D-alanyl-D-alanine-endopeptidase [Pseudomonadota bacterium]|nr:D-alanyl-D-alanine carboxypeptidase/D-alanyl-D-alanine-endopeptidase [Pseudomonadota bacterium]
MRRWRLRAVAWLALPLALAASGSAHAGADCALPQSVGSDCKAAADADAGALPEGLLAALRAAGIPAAALSLRVTGGDGRLRLDYRSGEVRAVGSLIKLFTTLAALDLLGPDFRFHTDLLAEPLAGPLPVWQLSLRGGGDPGLRYADLVHLLRAARAAGVEQVAPVVHVDRSRFAGLPGQTSGVTPEPGHVGVTPPSALLLEQSAVQLLLPARRRGQVLVDPPFPLKVSARTDADDAAPCPGNWPQGLQLRSAEPATAPAAGAPADAPQLVLEGLWPTACPETSVLRAPLSDAAYLDLALATGASSVGWTAQLHGVEQPAPALARVSLRQDSRPLAELVRDINKFSNNVMARTLFLALAAESGELPATPAAADRVIRRWLDTAGLHFPELAFENGSGLSHLERTTAAHLEQLLKYALTTAVSPEFVASLPIPGADGSLRTRFRDLAQARRLRLKSGGLDGVRSLAGYVLGRDGRIGTLVFVVNDAHAEAATPAMAAVLEWILRE